jgi:hypothetical protein
MTSPRLIIETEITQHGRRRPTTLRLDLETCRQAMAELARAERMLLAAAAAAGEPAAEPASGSGGDEPDPADPADGPAPRHAGPGEARCEAYDDDEGEGWLCTAQAGHGGPVHVAYGEDGTVARRWPAVTAAGPKGQDPYDPRAMPDCRCGDAAAEHSIRLIDRSRGACTTGCGCTRYQVRQLAAAAGGAQ